MLIVLDVRKLCRPEVCSKSITLQYTMLCSSHHAAHLHQYSKLLWERSCGCDKRILLPSPSSLAVPPMSWNNSVHGLTQHFAQMSMRHVVHPMDMGSYLDEATAAPTKIQLNHKEVSLEYYTGHAFLALEMAPDVDRHHGTRLAAHAIGSELNRTLNQEIVFSAALTGKPKKKLCFSQYCWKRCVRGTSSDYAAAVSKPEWEYALTHGDLQSLQQPGCKDPLIFLPQQRAAARRMVYNQAGRVKGVH